MTARAVAALSLAFSFSAVAGPRQAHLGFSSPACRSYFSHWFHFPQAYCLSAMPSSDSHTKARTSPYPQSSVRRGLVPDDKVSWSVPWPEYQPVDYTAPSVLAGPVWADPDISTSDFFPKFNQRDGKIQRKSLCGTYEVVESRPRNPMGRTGITGRGLLGRWGPNHAADPIITRWKRDNTGAKVIHKLSGKNILEFVAIKRRDCGEWAIPGGMVDPGEKIGATLKREFGEEAVNALDKTSAERQVLEEKLNLLFSQDQFEVYKGYVDDPRNTDNAWMETEAVNYHDDTGIGPRVVHPKRVPKRLHPPYFPWPPHREGWAINPTTAPTGAIMDNIPLEAGDDAGKVKWVAISKACQLYASHAHFIQLVAAKLDAHWS